MINKVDYAKRNYYLYHTGETFDSTAYQDFFINSSTLPFDKNVDLIYELSKAKLNLK